MRRFGVLLAVGSAAALGGAALAALSSSWTIYGVGFAVLCAGVLLVVAAARSVS